MGGTITRLMGASAACLLVWACGESEPESSAAGDTDTAAIAGDEVTSATAEQAAQAAAALAAENLAAAETYLAQNATVEGVTTTQSGLQYTVLATAEGGLKAQPDAAVCVHYSGRLIDGTIFDSSYDRGMPAPFLLDRVIPGFSEGIALMSTGDRYEFTIPPALAYGEAGAGDVIPPNSALIFEVELVDLLDPENPPLTADCSQAREAEAAAQASLAEAEAFLAQNATREDVVSTDSGLQYRIVTPGDANAAAPQPGEMVCVHYRGRLRDGTEFDSSYSRGAAAAFPSNRLIDGWVEALALMQPGAEWELFIHPDLGYGRRGSGPDIGPNALLLFDINLISVLGAEAPPAGVDCAAPAAAQDALAE